MTISSCYDILSVQVFLSIKISISITSRFSHEASYHNLCFYYISIFSCQEISTNGLARSGVISPFQFLIYQCFSFTSYTKISSSIITQLSSFQTCQLFRTVNFIKLSALQNHGRTRTMIENRSWWLSKVVNFSNYIPK